MLDLVRLCGFYAAHGVWSVSDGAALIPMLGFEQADGERGMTRFVAGDLGESARAGQAALAANAEGRRRAVLVVDGYVHLEVGRVDALILEAVDYASPQRWEVTVAVPYRPASSPDGFAVYRPKFLKISGENPPDRHEFGPAFFAGVDGHSEAREVWNAHIDNSL